jgi:hypothetical protein
MNTTEINGKEYTLTEGEGGKLTLTPLIKEPEQRKPEAGDVWRRNDWTYLIGEDLHGITMGDGLKTKTVFQKYYRADIFTYLGKFDDVYVKKADIIEALSINEHCEYSVLDMIRESTPIFATFSASGKRKIVEALAKLGIIAG